MGDPLVAQPFGRVDGFEQRPIAVIFAADVFGRQKMAASGLAASGWQQGVFCTTWRLAQRVTSVPATDDDRPAKFSGIPPLTAELALVAPGPYLEHNPNADKMAAVKSLVVVLLALP